MLQSFREKLYPLLGIDGIKYEGTVRVVRMWSHYDTVR